MGVKYFKIYYNDDYEDHITSYKIALMLNGRISDGRIVTYIEQMESISFMHELRETAYSTPPIRNK